MGDKLVFSFLLLAVVFPTKEDVEGYHQRRSSQTKSTNCEINLYSRGEKLSRVESMTPPITRVSPFVNVLRLHLHLRTTGSIVNRRWHPERPRYLIRRCLLLIVPSVFMVCLNRERTQILRVSFAAGHSYCLDLITPQMVVMIFSLVSSQRRGIFEKITRLALEIVQETNN